ncbi:MAG: 30S ribosomal protein S6 [Phycisphaerales bacterium]|nr:MAG: 30S ribosomal protein S6 [Phycisphaerales bacterium]
MTTEAPASTKTVNYEVMFLISQQEATDLAGIIEHIDTIFERAGAERLAMRKWDERRLAYDIDKQKRGVYILCYISADPTRVQSIDRDVNLSERILRILLLRADHLSMDQMKAADARRELEAEAKMRADRADQVEQTRSTVSLGAPEPEAAPAATEGEQAPAEEGAGQGEDADTAPSAEGDDEAKN